VLVALILTFSVAVPLTVQTITADASTASVAKKKKKKKKCKKGYKTVTVKKKVKKSKKCKKKAPPNTPEPTNPPAPSEAKVILDSVIQWAGTKVRFRGRLVDLDTNLARCTATAGYTDGFTDPHEFILKQPSKNEPFDEIVPMAADHGAIASGIVVCNDVSSGLTTPTV
jgi:hypothetical protein